MPNLRRSGFRGAGRVVIALSLFWTVGVVSALAAPQDLEQRISFRLVGGLGLPLNGGGDLDLNRQGWANYYIDSGGLSGYTGTANWKKMSLLPDVQIEAVFPLNLNISLGLGVGYIWGKTKGTYGYTYHDAGVLGESSYSIDQVLSWSRDYTLNAVPITMTLYLGVPAGRLNFYGYVGAGFYIAKLSHAYQSDWKATSVLYSTLTEQTDYTDVINGTEYVTKNGFGFHGGLGLEVMLGSSFAIGLEVYGRYLDIGGWTGGYNETETGGYRYSATDGSTDSQSQTNNYSNSGTLKYFEAYDSDLGKYYGQMWVYNTDPSGEGLRNVRDAKLNFNAVGLRLSLRVFFSAR